MATIRLRGIKANPTELKPSYPDFNAPPLSIINKGRVQLGSARDFGGIIDLPEIEPDYVACVEYSDGFKLWTRVDDLYAEHGKTAVRGTGTDPNIWELDPKVRSANTDRGSAKIVIQALEFFGVDLKEVAASELCEWFEKKQLQPKGQGLYQFGNLSGEFQLEYLQNQKIPAADKKLLLFVHGTGSSSQGGFAGLWDKTNPLGETARLALEKEFKSACFAYEHQSLTISPIENALAIAEALPNHAEIYLVTHSRGGLIGELLCLGQREMTPDPLADDWLAKVFDPNRDRTQGELFGFGAKNPEGYTDQKIQLRKLLEILDKKQVKVKRFVRVACPARGTTLATGRLDRWLSVLSHLSGSNDFVEFILGVVKKRTDPRTLPGIEAMMPGSALITLLNSTSVKTQADLTVIAGDIEGNSIWSKLKLQLTDWFYSSEHDLVVNTGSMYGGLTRVADAARFFFDQGTNVNHFNYFKNAATVEKLKDGLLRADSYLAGFQPIAAAKHQKPARGSRTNRSQLSPGPLAIVLPGTMGSHLTQDRERIWLDYFALTKSRLAELGIDAPDVEADGLLADFYGDFVEYLENTHRVESFAYDWRVSIIDSAKRLATLVENRLADCEARHQPLRFVAHSMGGLVVRVMFAMHPPLWKRFQALPGSRLMMLGTPNAGSYEAVRWLTGWNPTLDKLALLDFTHDIPGLVNIVNRYPGLLELLPANDGKLDYADPDIWQQICTGGDKKWPQPQADRLQALNKTWQWIKEAPIDSERMIYIAGWAEDTVSGFENTAGERGLFSKKRPPLRFFSTDKGDGTVPWSLGLLPGVRTWYVETSHDQLLAHAPAFPGYLDLLQTGLTSRLSPSAPASRSVAGSATPRLMPILVPDSLPTEADLPSFIFGAGQPQTKSKPRRLQRVILSIRHGDLAYARHPICVGHYHGDTIVSAEAALDQRLDGVLSKRVNLGLYPGDLNTHAVFFHHKKNAQPNGAIVIGLGRVGELSPGSLISGTSRALLDYALKISEWPDDRFGPIGTIRSAKVSFLLIGTGSGGMSIRNSIESILTAVKSANNRLLESGMDSKVLIDDIEFLELYRDSAILAARELENLLYESALASDFNWPDHAVQSGTGGKQRVVFDSDPAWWHRLEIIYDDKYQMLRFIALTDRARAEVSLVSGQMRLADQFIADMLSSTDGGNALESAQTLFEMLMPNRLKELAPNQLDLVLIVDEVSARYPWELLADRWNIGKKPPSVSAGMLRQLKTQQFRNKPLHTAEKNALVIGNPAKPKGNEFPDLPGAGQEAEAVAALLADYSYSVNKALGKRQTGLEAKTIIKGLHADAYRILHLAGHGVHEFPILDETSTTMVKRVSGMAIGDGIFLTPGDIEQMRWVPELVFINCCHLGSTEIRYPEAKRYNELAANLGMQFINMGVRAVVAAGWAVDDDAAKAFAESFYRAILSGQPFGYAVQLARQQIYEQFPNVNTWGAYQCYGDPDFRLFEDGQNPPKQTPSYHDKSEWLADLDNLLNGLRSQSSKQSDESTKAYLSQLLERVPTDHRSKWSAQADVAALLGTIYGELGEYNLAIQHLDKAFSANKADLPVKALEQRANYRVKQALRFLTAGDEAEKDQAIQAIHQSITELDMLNTMTPTLERLSMLGSAYKRLAWMQKDKNDRNDALKNMCTFYKLAYQKGLETKISDPYPFTNWITAEAIVSWFDKNRGTEWQQDLSNQIHTLISEAKQRLTINPQYWDCVVEPDCLSTLSLVNGKMTDEDFKVISEAYRQAVERGASVKDQNALREHIEFLISIANVAKKSALAKRYEELLRFLTWD